MATAPREVWGDLATTALIESSHLFRPLEDEARQDLIRLASIARYGPGEAISGPAGEGLYLIADGAAALEVSGPGGAIEVALLERGAVFGAWRVVGGSSRAWSLAARTEVSAVAFPAPVMEAIAARSPRVRALLSALVAAREREAAARLPP